MSDEVTHTHTFIICIYGNSNTTCDPIRALVMYYTPIYIAYMRYQAGQLVFVIRISVPFHESVPKNRTLSSTGPLSVL